MSPHPLLLSPPPPPPPDSPPLPPPDGEGILRQAGVPEPTQAIPYGPWPAQVVPDRFTRPRVEPFANSSDLTLRRVRKHPAI